VGSEPNQVGVPRRGFYKARLINGALHVGVMIWHGRPVIEGERQDRAPRWCIAVNGRTTDKDGELLDVFERWPFVCGDPISHREFAFMKRRRLWARKHAPEHPAANPFERIDLGKLKPMEP
jgi:hypothetical protein